MDITIRPMRPTERGRFLARVVETSWKDLPAYQQARYSQEEIAPAIEQVVELLMAQGENLILVADLGGQENVGQVWLGQARDPYTGQRRGYIYDLYVEATTRRRGIGRQLLQAAESASRTRGDGELGITVAATNEGARALYDAFGFHLERLTMSKPLEV